MDEIKKYCAGVKGLLFDYGGTLDTGGRHWSNVIRDAWLASGVETDLPTFREAYVYAERELARTRYIFPEHDFIKLLQIKVNIELQWLAHQDKFPAQEVESKATQIAAFCDSEARKNIETVRPLLQSLSETYPMVLVSNFYGNLTTVLKEYGIDKFFKKVIESAVEGIRKPDAGIFSLGVKALGLNASDCLVVGDSYSKDIVPALKTGCRALWLKGESWEKDENIEYPYTINNLMKLQDILL